MVARRRALGALVLALVIGAVVHAAMRHRTSSAISRAVRFIHDGRAPDSNVLELMRVATESSDPRVIASAIEALGRLHRLADSPLATRFIDDGRPYVRRATIVGLGLDGSPKGVPLLEKGLGDPVQEHRALALQALGRIGSADAKAAVRKMLSRPELSALERTLGRQALAGDQREGD